MALRLSIAEYARLVCGDSQFMRIKNQCRIKWYNAHNFIACPSRPTKMNNLNISNGTVPPDIRREAAANLKKFKILGSQRMANSQRMCTFESGI